MSAPTDVARPDASVGDATTPPWRAADGLGQRLSQRHGSLAASAASRTSSLSLSAALFAAHRLSITGVGGAHGLSRLDTVSLPLLHRRAAPTMHAVDGTGEPGHSSSGSGSAQAPPRTARVVAWPASPVDRSAAPSTVGTAPAAPVAFRTAARPSDAAGTDGSARGSPDAAIVAAPDLASSSGAVARTTAAPDSPPTTVVRASTTPVAAGRPVGPTIVARTRVPTTASPASVTVTAAVASPSLPDPFARPPVADAMTSSAGYVLAISTAARRPLAQRLPVVDPGRATRTTHRDAPLARARPLEAVERVARSIDDRSPPFVAHLVGRSGVGPTMRVDGALAAATLPAEPARVVDRNAAPDSATAPTRPVAPVDARSPMPVTVPSGAADDGDIGRMARPADAARPVASPLAPPAASSTPTMVSPILVRAVDARGPVGNASTIGAAATGPTRQPVVRVERVVGTSPVMASRSEALPSVVGMPAGDEASAWSSHRDSLQPTSTGSPPSGPSSSGASPTEPLPSPPARLQTSSTSLPVIARRTASSHVIAEPIVVERLAATLGSIAGPSTDAIVLRRARSTSGSDRIAGRSDRSVDRSGASHDAGPLPVTAIGRAPAAAVVKRRDAVDGRGSSIVAGAAASPSVATVGSSMPAPDVPLNLPLNVPLIVLRRGFVEAADRPLATTATSRAVAAHAMAPTGLSPTRPVVDVAARSAWIPDALRTVMNRALVPVDRSTAGIGAPSDASSPSFQPSSLPSLQRSFDPSSIAIAMPGIATPTAASVDPVARDGASHGAGAVLPSAATFVAARSAPGFPLHRTRTDGPGAPRRGSSMPLPLASLQRRLAVDAAASASSPPSPVDGAGHALVDPAVLSRAATPAPAPVAIGAHTDGSTPAKSNAVDLDELCERTVRKLMRMLTVEKERRGLSTWPS